MTTTEVIALLMTPLGGLMIGAFVYWISTRPEKPSRPAE